MKILFGMILLVLALGIVTESASAQSKGKKGKKSVKSSSKKKAIDDKTDTVLEEQKVSIKLETPRTKFVVERLYPDVKVDFSRFGDLTDAVNADAQRAIYRTKIEERPEPISTRKITRQADK